MNGKIVIARYGESWRGIKPRVAADHGAIGCIIYSDPRDDGYWQGDAYPNGAERNPTSVQRGSVADIPTYPGDPSSPGVKKHFTLQIEDQLFAFPRKAEQIAAEAALDGIYILRTSTQQTTFSVLKLCDTISSTRALSAPSAPSSKVI